MITAAQTVLQSLNIWIVLLLIWSLPWKAVALWRAARVNHRWWFIAFLVVNTFGILEILYIFFWNKPQKEIVQSHRELTTHEKDTMFQK
jgi:hypothetical protein